jgi:17beta-estradiol 17-dehydrogenase / very-long-chain 3-oxoacyl-CoA reductase
VDFSRTDIYDRIRTKLESLDGSIHILVNNVGTAHPAPEYFASEPGDYHLNLINTNCVSVTLMSEIVLQIWAKKPNVQSQQRPKGVIVNISSAAGLLETPLYSSYSACK